MQTRDNPDLITLQSIEQKCLSILQIMAHDRMALLQGDEIYWGTDSNNLWIETLKRALRFAGVSNDET